MVEFLPDIEVPRSRDAVSFSIVTSKLPLGYADLWAHLMRVVGASLRAFYDEAGADVLCCVELSRGWDRKKQPATILAVCFSTDGHVTREAMAALEPPLAGSGLSWSVDGVQRRARTARPVMACAGGELVRIWQEFEGQSVASVVQFDGSVDWHLIVADQARPEDFLEHIAHARCRTARRPDEDARRIERLKVGFGYAVAQQIIEADGVIEPSEIAFVDSHFPPAVLAQWGINDENCDEVRAEAERTLPEELGHHEKLSLLSLFYAACYADGRIELRELSALRGAAESIGLKRGEVAAYLQRLW